MTREHNDEAGTRARTSHEPRRAFQLPSAKSRLNEEIEAEFKFHFDERVDQFVAQGMTRELATAEVAKRFGDYDSYLKRAREIDSATLQQRSRAGIVRTFQRELRRAVRVLWRDRGFTATAFVTLTLGLGATTAIFTVLDAVVLRALPYRDADALVSVMHPATVPGSGERTWGLSPGGYFSFRQMSERLADLSMYSASGFTVTNNGQAEVSPVARVTASLFPVLRAQPSVGRLLGPDDDQPGAPQVAVLSHEFFTRRFGADEKIIGQNLETDVGSFEIVGVAEPGLTLPMPGPFSSSSNLAGLSVDVWTPLQLNASGPFYNNHPYVGIGRLKEGVSVEDARQEFSALFPRVTEQLPDVYSPGFLKQYNFRVSVAPLRDAVLGPTVPRVLWMLFGAVVLVLCIAAANVGNLFLLRFEARRRESAIRSALGAHRAHMAAHYLAETLLLCLTAGVAGLAFASVALRALIAIAPANIPRLANVALSARATLVSLAVAVLLALVLGLLPLLRRGLDTATLRDGGRGLSASKRQRAARQTLVVAQLALTLVLLSGAGLMWRSFDTLREVEPGFNAESVLAFELSLPFSRFDTREKAAVFHEELQQRLSALPGIVSVGAGPMPLEDFGTGCSVVFREGRPYDVNEQTPCVATPTAIPGYFEALGMSVEGRTPNWSDVSARSHAVVVTRALADRLWPGEDPIGRGIGSNGPDATEWYRVVGVLPELRAEALDVPPTEAVFYAATGLRAGVRSGELNDLSVFVRTAGADPFRVLPAIREVIREMDAQVPIVRPRALTEVVNRSMSRTSFILTLLAVAATIALTLSAVGTYGVISYLVTQRRTEMGVRLALGATAAQVVRLVVSQSAKLALLGVGIGVVAALAGTRLMASLLYGVAASDAAVLLSGTALLLTVVLLASWVPARRASEVDPGEAMREH
jgi:predicted permease